MRTLLHILGSTCEVFLVDGAAFLLRELWHVVVLMFRKEPLGKPAYDARFEDHGDVSRWNRGFAVTGTKFLTLKASTRNQLVVAPTGGGKTTTLILPSIFRLVESGHSFVCNDPPNEAFPLVAPFLAQNGYSVTHLDMANPLASCGFNPLLHYDAHKLAARLGAMRMGKQQKDPFWEQAASGLNSNYIRLVQKALPGEYRHLANVLQLLKISAASPKLIDRLVVASRDEQILAEYKAFLGISSENTRGGIIATAKAVLEPFADEKLALLTSWDSVPLDRLRDRHAFFISTPSLEAEYYRFCASLLFDLVLGRLLEKLPGKDDKRHCFLLLDEVTSLHIDSLPRTLEVSRKYNFGSMLCVQSLNQLNTVYRDNAQSIIDNCNTQIYLSPSEGTAEKLEKMLGQTEYVEDGRLKVRPLMTKSQIKALPSDEGIALFPNANPMLCDLVPYYRSRFKRYAALPPYCYDIRPPHDTAPLISEKILDNLLANGRI